MIYPENPEREERDEKKERSEALANILTFCGLVVAAVVWWEFFKTPVMFVVTLGILVAIHEWGHFVAMKSVGVRVYEFALGFGPRLVTYMRRNGTEYTIRAFPLGGFVHPKGMQPDDPITPDGLNGKTPGQRAFCYLAGPAMNLILGVAVYCFSGFAVGTWDDSRVLVGDVVRKKAAERMEVATVNGRPAGEQPRGLRVGDHILQVNGRPVDGMATVVDEINPRVGQQVTLTVRRRRDTLELVGTPTREESGQERFITVTQAPAGGLDVRVGDQVDRINGQRLWDDPKSLETARRLLQENAGQPVSVVVWRGGERRLELSGPAAALGLEIRPGKRWVGQLGFQPIPGAGPRVSAGASVSQGLERAQFWFRQIVSLFSRPKQLGKSVGGPVAIYKAVGEMDRLPVVYYLSFLASLSLSLAVFNLLPVPILDGGHLLLVTVEALRRRRLEPATQRAVQMVGLAIIGVLFVYIMSKDIVKHFL